MLNNILATALGMLMVASVRLPNLRVGVMLLAGLFLYDIFWVFASASVFGSNVMVAVAMHHAANPMAVAADAVNLHSDLVVATLELPAKLVIPSGPDGSVALGAPRSDPPPWPR